MTTTTTNTDQQVAQGKTLEQVAHKIVKRYLDDYINDHQLEQQILLALRNEREARFELTEREKRILIDHHNYEAEKAITRTGCRETERYHRNRAKAIREGR